MVSSGVIQSEYRKTMANPATRSAGLAAMAVLLIPAVGLCSDAPWPDLPSDCFVRARPATQADVRKGCAAFVIGKNGLVGGVPLDIQIPQYAWHIEESGKRSPVILIQAEERSGIKAVGYKDLSSQGLGAALLKEIVLLGVNKPTP